MTIKVLICDDQDIVRQGLQLILETSPGIEVVGIAEDGEQALELIPKSLPDVVLMDLKMPGMNGIQATRLIRDRYPAVHVLALTIFDADEWVFDAIRSGAAGYLLKDMPRDRLVEALRDTVEGKTHVDPAVAGKLLSKLRQVPASASTSVANSLSEREREILSLLAQGLSNADIAARLYLSEGTVGNYVSSIYGKLGVSDRTQAAVWAMRYGLTDLNG
jgi:DNA-binding NarL/FixJ family response regulator